MGVDDVEDGHAALREGEMVVLFGLAVFEDVGGVAGVFCGDFEQVEQPGGGVFHVVDVEVFVGDHVGDEEGFDLAEGAVVVTTWRRGGGCRRGSLSCRHPGI